MGAVARNVTMIKVPEGWALWDGSKTVSPVYAVYSACAAARDRYVVKLDRPKPVQRPCMCCRQTFTSTGKGHRMCDSCRRLGGSLGKEFIGR